ncbi:hypothetical protein LA080_011097 [Diaporthe eres]|nr:hypothetical protein LA080_011097 [Diaporthe eres]
MDKIPATAGLSCTESWAAVPTWPHGPSSPGPGREVPMTGPVCASVGGRNDIAAWRKLARRRPLLFECWSRSRNSSSSRNSGNNSSSRDGQQRCDRDAPHTHSPPTADHPPKARMEQLAATARLSCRHGLAKEGRQHVIAEIWNVDLKPNAQAF